MFSALLGSALAVTGACSISGHTAATTTTSHSRRTTAVAPTGSSTVASHRGFVAAELFRASDSVVYVVGTLWSTTGGRVELFRSDDGGSSFQEVTTPPSGRPTYA